MSDKKRVEGYWKSLKVERDAEYEARRRERILEADRRRKQRAAEIAAQGPGKAHERLRRTLRGRMLDTALIIGLLVLGAAVALGIISQQKAALPSWVPVLGEDFFYLEGEFQTSQAVTPGQGQSVTIAGIEVGQIESVRLEDGKAVVGMNIKPKYAPVIRADAGLLLRPRTNLQDMTLQIDPGAADKPIAEDTVIPVNRTESNVNPDEFFARLDADTRDYLTLLIEGGGTGLGGRGRQLSPALRRFEPFTRYIAELNSSLAKRRDALARVIHDFGRLTEELGQHDDEIARFVSASSDALGGFADQQQAIRSSLEQLPPTLSTTRGALESANTLSNELRPTLTGLIPQAIALQPGLASTQDFFSDTEPVLREQLRPFSRQVRPIVRHTSQLADPFSRTINRFGSSLNSLNYGFNELAYNPGQEKPGYLFYLPWLNHNLNSLFRLQDGAGPLRRGMLLLSCNSTDLAGGHVLTRPFLNTLYQATNAPTRDEIC